MVPTTMPAAWLLRVRRIATCPRRSGLRSPESGCRVRLGLGAVLTSSRGGSCRRRPACLSAVLAKKSSVEQRRFAAGLEPEPLVEFSRESLVPVGHRLPASERSLCFQGQLNGALVRCVQSSRRRGVFECARGVVELEAEPTGALEEVGSQRCQTALFALRPERVDPCERMSEKQRECSFD